MTGRDRHRLAAMDALGRRAMEHVRQHCPSRYRQIPDPIGFFTDLGEQMRDQVTGAAESLATAPPPPDPTTPEGWVERLGKANMAALMAEERVFSEMVTTVLEPFLPEEDPEEEAGWTPLMPDFPDLDQAEEEGTT
ncbi:MAG: hypothetical protein ACRD2W_12765 [Acidimicrobiales bacterium]